MNLRRLMPPLMKSAVNDCTGSRFTISLLLFEPGDCAATTETPGAKR
jgi:hypothetical protein